MFGKCLKHEFRATARQLVPLLIAQLAVSVAAGVFLGISLNGATSERASALSGFAIMLSVFLMLAMMALIVAVSVVAFVMIIRRFYTAFFTDEGYLTFTLPVTPNEHIFSKFITAYVWQALSTIATFVSIFIVLLLAFSIGGDATASPDAAVSSVFSEVLRALQLEAGATFLPAFVGLTILNLVVGVAASVFMIYLSISAACMLAKKHRVILGIVCFYVINLVFSSASQVLQFVLALVTRDSFAALLIGLAVSTVIYVIQAILCYLGTKWVLTKKLNLD